MTRVKTRNARNKKTRVRKKKTKKLDARLRFHLYQMGMQSVGAYLGWCRLHGFKIGFAKSDRDLERELDAHRRQTAMNAMREARRRRDPIDVILRVIRGEYRAATIANRNLQYVAAQFEFAGVTSKHRKEIASLVEVVGRRSRILLESMRSDVETFHYVNGVVKLLEARPHWVRPVETFRPRSRNRQRQFAQLARHLLAHYHVPAFLDMAWLRQDDTGHRGREWFRHVGQGHNIRTARVPIDMTKRLAHVWMQVPHNVSIEDTFRFAQVRELGGKNRLARAVVASNMCDCREHQLFWLSVIRFFVRNDELPLDEVPRIATYLEAMKFETVDWVHPDGRIEVCPPPKPQLSMRGRKLETLLRDVDRWHRTPLKDGGDRQWPACGIAGHEEIQVLDAHPATWRIQELRSRWSLVKEGQAMRHCVASYDDGCERGRYSIWSVTRERRGKTKRMQTVQVNKARRIVECRGRLNADPNETVKAVIGRWAAREGLELGVLS